MDFGPPNPPSKSVQYSNTLLLLLQIYSNFFKEVNIGGWCTKGLKAPTIGIRISVCTAMLGDVPAILGCVRNYIRLRVLLY